MIRILVACIALGLLSLDVLGQGRTIYGTVTDSLFHPIPDVNVRLADGSAGARTDERGVFQLKVQEGGNIILIFSHVNFYSRQIEFPDNRSDSLLVQLREDVRMLEQVEIRGRQAGAEGPEISTVYLNPIEAKTLPSAFQDISRLLTTLPGVNSPSELSSSYSVRGGNYDENLVYVDNMPVYRPLLVRAGQQEGLSFPNPDLISGVEFNSGGWPAVYGDGLASVLNTRYRRPEEAAGSLSVGLLGGTGHIEGTMAGGKVSYLLGARHRRAQYLLNTLETKGEYRPFFTDIQSYVEVRLRESADKSSSTSLGFLLYYGRNRYNVVPESRETTFGTFSNQLRLFVAFNGQDRLQYDAYQGGVKLSHRFNRRLTSEAYLSVVYTREREYFDVESAYRLCGIDINPGSSTFDQCVINLGIGSQYDYGRNQLNAAIGNAELRNKLQLNAVNWLEFGFGYSRQSFEDRLLEYTIIDSAGFSTVPHAVDAENELHKNNYFTYLQHSAELGDQHRLQTGIRFNYLDINRQLLFSPRLQYAFYPRQRRHLTLKFSSGLYQQPPFYREMRNRAGELNTDLKAQSSWHNIAALEWSMRRWGRPFRLSAEVYYKHLWNVVPYDVENVRLRYYGLNNAVAYAAGADFRLSGEFIPGEESWFSLGLLQTREDVEGDGQGYIPRPTDQWINLNIFFQDHLPGNPTYKMYLNLLYASALPFSPPDSPEYRNSFRGSDYSRVDLGFSKQVYFKRNRDAGRLALRSLWIGLEVLNLTGSQNIISYNWVRDVNSVYYAVPNSLSARFLNLRLIARF
jgi:hypothetical protein